MIVDPETDRLQDKQKSPRMASKLLVASSQFVFKLIVFVSKIIGVQVRARA